MRASWAFAAALSASLGAREATALAEPAQAVDLRWEAHAPGCIEQGMLAELVERTLGRGVFHGSGPSSAIVDGRIERAGRAFRAHITLRASTGEVLGVRDIETSSESCDRLDESLVVVIALMIDGLRAPAAAPSPSPVPSAPSDAIAAVPAPPSPSPEPARIVVPSQPRRGHLDLVIVAEAGLVASFGVLPHGRAGTYLRAGLGTEAVSVAMHMHTWLPDRTLVNGSGAGIAAWAASLDACAWPFRPAHWRLGACLGVGAGWMTATPIGLVDGGRLDQATLPLAFAAGSLDVMGRLVGQLWGHIRLSAWCPFVVPTYFYHQADGSSRDLFRPWIVAPSIALGLVARSPS